MNNLFAKAKDVPIIYDIFKNGKLVNGKKGLGFEGQVNKLKCINYTGLIHFL